MPLASQTKPFRPGAAVLLAMISVFGVWACTPAAGRTAEQLALDDAAFVRNTAEADALVRLLGHGNVEAVADRFHYPAISSRSWVDELHERVAADLYLALAGFGDFSDASLFTDTRELAWIEIHSVNRGYWAALGVRSMYVVTHAVNFARVGPGFVQIFFHDTGDNLEIAWIQFAVDKSEQGLIERALALAPVAAAEPGIAEQGSWVH